MKKKNEAACGGGGVAGKTAGSAENGGALRTIHYCLLGPRPAGLLK